MASRSTSKSKKSTKDSPRPRNVGRVVAICVLLFAVAGIGSAVVNSGVFGGDETATEAAGTAADPNTGENTGENTGGSLDDASVDSPDGDQDLAGAQAGTSANNTLAAAPPKLGAYQELVDLDGWINADAVDLSSYDGQVRIVKFWTFGCFNCKNTLPHLRDIYSRWQPEGLEIVAVHSPEFEYERDPVAVEQATVDQNIPWPVALDTDKKNFRIWQGSRRFWPRTYVLDRSGQIRYDHIGEGKYDELEATVAYLIENPGA